MRYEYDTRHFHVAPSETRADMIRRSAQVIKRLRVDEGWSLAWAESNARDRFVVLRRERRGTP